MKNSIIVTGASGSMGAQAVKALCKEGYPVIMACRNRGKAESVRSSILLEVPSAEIDIRLVDMASLDSVREFAYAMNGRTFSGLFNNAGVINREFGLTSDGFERTVAVNYLAPYLLTRLLLNSFEDGAHIVNMVSLTTKLVSIGEDFLCEDRNRFSQLKTYARSKLGLLLFSVELARRAGHIKVNVADPGIVNSNMISMGRWFDPLADVLFRPFCKSPQKGAAPAVAAMLGAESGRYFVGKGIKDIPDRFLNHPMLTWLWDETEKLLQL